MFLLWISVFSLSMSWLFSLRLYTSPVATGTFILIGISLLSAGIAFKKIKWHLDEKFIFLSPLLLLPAWILPFPYNIGSILLFTGLITLPLSKRFTPLSFLSTSLLFNGTLFIFQSLLPNLYFLFTSKNHYFHPLTSLIYHLLNFLQVPVSYSQNTIFIRMYRHLYAFPTTWEKLALLPYLCLFVGGLFLFLVFPNSSRMTHASSFLSRNLKVAATRISYFLLTLVAYLIIRYLLMILLFLYTMYFVIFDEIIRMDLFWNPNFTLFSFIPILFLLWRFFPLVDLKNGNSIGKIATAFAVPSWNRIILIRAATFVLGVLFLVASFGFHDPGKLKMGRILIDEKHSDWEKTTRPYDTEWYGVDSGYNYATIADYLSYFYKVERNFIEITPELLSNHDILILKIPSRAFFQEEIEAILQFVKEGGGLYLIGDHTNVFGSGHYLNEIARHFGFVFRYDCLFDFEDTFNEVYSPPRLLPHPIVNSMPPFLFAVSCSIEPLSFFNERVILANGLKALDIDYAIENFYPRARDLTEMTF